MIGFPGIGWGFTQNPVIFPIGETFALTWYALILVTGLLAAVWYCMRQTEHFGIKQDEVYDVLFCAVPAAVIGARLYYVAFDWASYKDDPITILYTWHGGLAIYGCIIGAVIATVLFCRFRRVNTGAMLDLGAMGLLIGQAIGRWGNYVNGEIYGMETTVPWRMRVPSGSDVHPLFLYESLWNILGLVLLRLFMKKRKYNGQMFTLYVAWYGLGRAVLEGMRHPEFNLKLGDVMISQFVAILSCVAALAVFFITTFFKKTAPLMEWTEARDEYESLRRERKGIVGETGEIEETEAAEDGTEETATEDAPLDEGAEATEPEEVTEEEEAEDNGDADGREESGEEDKE
jgi:phosphatidylglycerol:prolipoprotein diacylglycerol transferase